MTAALRFERVSKVYPVGPGGTLYALREVSFQVPAGRTVAVSGRSGSGKSTLLHLAAGVDTPSTGEVSLFGAALSSLPDAERTRLRRERVGLVFQFFHLLPHLSVRDNVALPGWIAGDPPSAWQPRVAELLERVELSGLAGQEVEKLSGGEMQRVAICRALLRRPKLLLADEPTGNLDDEAGRRVMELLLQLVAEEQASLVYVTHSRELADLADESWGLHSGVLEAR